MRIGRLSLAVAVAAFFGATASAAAEEPVETAIKGWVASIDATADWAASFAGLSYDAASKKATLTGLSIRSEKPGIEADIATVTVTGYVAAAGGGFSAARIAADRGMVTAGPLSVEIADVELNEFAMPAVGGVAFDPQRLFTSIIRAYAPLVRIKLTNGRIGSIAFLQETNGVRSRIDYGQFRIDRWVDGKIAAITAGPLSMEAPSPDGLMRMKVASVEGRDIDMEAFLRVYDPTRYASGVGDMVWRPVMRLAAYRDFAIEGPGLKMSLGLVSLENFRLRQPRRSFAEYFDRVLADPDARPDEAESMEVVLNMLSAYGIGRFGISKLDVQATGIDRFQLGGFNLSDLSMDGLGEFAIDNFDGLIREQGSVKIGRFAFGGMVFPGFDRLLAAAKADAAGDEPDVMSLIPKLGFVEARAIDVTTPEISRATLERLRVDLGKYVGPIPTSIVADLAGLVIPVSVIDDPEGRAVFRKLGIDRIDLGYGLKVGWTEPDQTVKVDELRVALKGIGRFAASMALLGLPRAAIERPDTLPRLIPALKLRAASFTFTDDSIVGKGLDLLAEKMHAPPERFRQQFADAIPFLLRLTALNDPRIMALVAQSGILAKLQPVLKAFIATPGSSITIALAPPIPVAVPEIAETSQKAPEKLAELVGLSFATTGVIPAAEPSPQSPAPRNGQAPAQGSGGATTGGGSMKPSVP